MELSTIIVSYGTFDMTCDAIASVQASSPELEQEIIVVDNDSSDDSGPRLVERFAGDHAISVQIIQMKSNVGFAAANNVGAQQAAGKVLFFLNSDTLVASGSIAELFRFTSSQKGAGAVGPHVVNEDGSDQESTAKQITFGGLLRHFLPGSALFRSSLAKAVESPRETCSVDVVKGCAIAMRREVFDSIGGWDDSYFLYAEERELCFALLRTGYKNYFLRSARVVHFGGASTLLEDYASQQIIQQRSSLAFLTRHHSRSLVYTNRVLGIVGFGLRGMLFSVIGLFNGSADFQKRGEAARKLFAWFLLDYSVTSKS